VEKIPGEKNGLKKGRTPPHGSTWKKERSVPRLEKVSRKKKRPCKKTHPARFKREGEKTLKYQRGRGKQKGRSKRKRKGRRLIPEGGALHVCQQKISPTSHRKKEAQGNLMGER